MLKSSYEFEVLVNGHSAKEYLHKGSYYIEGKEGSRFSLRMRNNSGGRVLFVPTVDGLSIMNGKEASFKSRGYIVNSYDSLTIDGWRTSDDKVAEFFFAASKNSYAKKMNKGGNLGVIGCAVFKEKQKVQVIEIPYPVYKENCRCPHNRSFCLSCNDSSTITNTSSLGASSEGLAMFSTSSLSAQARDLSIEAKNLSREASRGSSMKTFNASLGTGFGQDKYSPVITVDFDKENSPAEVFSIFYNTRQNLENLGIEFRKPVYASPSAFPKEDDYCERP